MFIMDTIATLYGSNMSTFTGLYVDPARSLPEIYDHKIWTVARSFHEAVVKLELIEFEELSLEYDLDSWYGDESMTGYNVLMWLLDRKRSGLHVLNMIKVHSSNATACRSMKDFIENYLQ